MDGKDIKIGTRWSGAEWAEEKREVMVIGVGGIGSWLALNLSRIEHSLYLVDGDVVDETNVMGGQMYRTEDIGRLKVDAVQKVCRQFGCTNSILPISAMYSESVGMLSVCITALDNMAARKLVFEEWVKQAGSNPDALFMDGRLLLELMEIITVQGGNEDLIQIYREKYLFEDGEVEELDCTTKQTTFSAMTIAGMMTATFCNWLTNRKLGMDFREVPLHQRLYLPIFDYKTTEYAKEEGTISV